MVQSGFDSQPTSSETDADLCGTSNQSHESWWMLLMLTSVCSDFSFFFLYYTWTLSFSFYCFSLSFLFNDSDINIKLCLFNSMLVPTIWFESYTVYYIIKYPKCIEYTISIVNISYINNFCSEFRLRFTFCHHSPWTTLI